MNRFLDKEAILSNKTGEALWIASHCPTEDKREEYVAKLSQFMQGILF